MDLIDPPGGSPPPAGATSTWSDPGGDGPFASVLGQVATALVVGGGILLACSQAGAAAWGVLVVLALGVGIAIGQHPGVAAFFRARPGALVAVATIALTGLLVIVIWMAAGTGPPGGVVLVAGALVLGMDWTRVLRLRALVLWTAPVVVVAAFAESAEVDVATVVWLAVAFGALALLEADRRAGQPQVEPLARATAGTARSDDLLFTVLLAAAVAVLAAVVLSVPSCQPRGPSPGSGVGVPGGAGAGGTGGASDHLYVPDPDGNFLIPEDFSGTGTGTGGVGGDGRIPDPGSVPRLAPGEQRTGVDADGTALRYEGRPDGSIDVTVLEPDGTETRYRFTERSDGLTRIDRFDERGEVDRTWFYDPEGVAAQEGVAADDGSTVPPDEVEDQQDDRTISIPWRRIALVLLALAVIGGLVAWLVRRLRRPPPPGPGAAPPWALRLAAAIEREGAARGRSRRTDESVVRYGHRLVAEGLLDGRLAEVAAVVSDALFSRRDPGPELQARTEATFEAILADHPIPSRTGRG